MADPLKNILEPIKDLQKIRGVSLPIGLEFLQLVVTGPPGAGKTFYIEQIGGWPNEGYLDLTQKGWWKNQSLVFRPREVHLGLPFSGFKEALTVFDKEWLGSTPPLELELARIKLPPVKNRFYQTDWRARYIFEFLIPGPSKIFKQRLSRQDQGYFPGDENLSLDTVRKQVDVYRETALYLHRAGINVFIRKGLDKPPMRIAEKAVTNVPTWTIGNPPRRPSLKSLSGWEYLVRQKYPIRWIALNSTLQDLKTASRVAHDGRSFELLIGSIKLRFQPEIALGVKRRTAQKNWIINTLQGCSTRSINGFMRICTGETIVIGHANQPYAELFKFDDSVANRHLTITNRRGDLILNPLTLEKKTQIVRLDDFDYRRSLEKGRYKALLGIRNIYGQEITPLPAYKALEVIRKVNELLKDEPFRQKNKAGLPGGLVELPNKITPVIVGDLHARVDNLLKILSENCLLDCLRMKTATMILLGDTVHSEVVGEMDSFETSMLMTDLLVMLKLRFPKNLFYLRGNHESFSPDIQKNGILQGELFKDALLKYRGGDYVAELQKFYDLLPYTICAEHFLACHAGPPRWKTNRDELIEIASNEKLASELTNNRLSTPNKPAGYTKGDVKKFRKSLGLSARAEFFVGHTPMDPFGSYWINAGGIKKHHIIYSAQTEGASLIIRTKDNYMPISFPAEPLTDLINKVKL